ncbi:hypothetical protein QYM36_005786 [Artemia franciscana]|uniref:Uncharacterized protein n=1 Tax=Artemia franciscana TaxID=6661 RepID=A0AA88I1V2_ARTSF|nr:hypothetical protein QYM36_005786 [Artemia franciscana]
MIDGSCYTWLAAHLQMAISTSHTFVALISIVQLKVFYELLDLTPWDGCSRNSTVPVQLDQGGFVPILNRGNCTVEERVNTLKAAGFAGMIIVTPRALRILSNVTIPSDFQIVLINPSTKEAINKLGNNLKISAYSPPEGVYFDGSLLLIFALAVGSVAIGSFWSGIVRYHLVSGSSMDATSSADRSSMYLPRKLSKEEVSVSLTPMMIVVFVFCMVNMLLLLYWFFDYLVYVIIGLFAFASATAVYQCLEPLFMKITPKCVWSYNESANRRSIVFRLNQIVLFTIACSLSVVWVVYRKESWAWILQDILGVAFSINMLRLIRLPNFKICTILLVVLFFYDIFFVFITPFFTKNGESIMVEVASGGHSDSSVGGSGKISEDEQLPMLLRVPHLGYHPFDACYTRHSLLGFGDILVPGLLVSFCHYIDLKMKTPFKIYWVSTLAEKGTGLCFDFTNMDLEEGLRIPGLKQKSNQG